MNCMKCGREMEPGRVFCPECLEEMEKYPVKPGTVVQLPRRQDFPAQKKAPRKKSFPLEEQVKHLRKRVRLWFFLWVVTTVIALVLGFAALMPLFEDTKLLPGQNYSAATAATTISTEPN